MTSFISFGVVFCAMGMGVWLGLAVVRHKDFVGVSSMSIVRSILMSVFLWPVVIVLVLNEIDRENKK